jgi:hypothetical protein
LKIINYKIHGFTESFGIQNSIFPHLIFPNYAAQNIVQKSIKSENFGHILTIAFLKIESCFNIVQIEASKTINLNHAPKNTQRKFREIQDSNIYNLGNIEIKFITKKNFGKD